MPLLNRHWATTTSKTTAGLGVLLDFGLRSGRADGQRPDSHRRSWQRNLGLRSAFWPRFCVRAGHGGAYFDVSLADTIAGWSVWEVADHLGTGEDPGPLGTAHRLAAPYQKHSYVVAVSFWPSTVRIVHGYR